MAKDRDRHACTKHADHTKSAAWKGLPVINHLIYCCGVIIRTREHCHGWWCEGVRPNIRRDWRKAISLLAASLLGRRKQSSTVPLFVMRNRLLEHFLEYINRHLFDRLKAEAWFQPESVMMKFFSVTWMFFIHAIICADISARAPRLCEQSGYACSSGHVKPWSGNMSQPGAWKGDLVMQFGIYCYIDCEATLYIKLHLFAEDIHNNKLGVFEFHPNFQ
jgi:hypothetical protein